VTTDYKIIIEHELAPQHKKALIEGLNHHAFQKKGLGKDNGSFSLVILDNNDNFLGGLQAYHYYGCCDINLLFVTEEERGKDYGSLLMQKAEEIARERHCLFITLNTMDFEARPFYEKHGFNLEFVREGFQKGSVMYYMRKEIK
jgi:GNAT superfamily N-acetyltransferase